MAKRGSMWPSSLATFGLTAKVARRYTAPALKSMAETRRLAEAEGFGDSVDGHLVLGEQLLGTLEAQAVEYLLVAAAQQLQVPAQGPR